MNGHFIELFARKNSLPPLACFRDIQSPREIIPIKYNRIIRESIRWIFIGRREEA